MSKYNRLTTMSMITDSPTLKALCESCGESGCDEFCERYQDNYCKGCPTQEAFQRLSDYEDSGLSPENVKDINNTLKLAKEALTQWANDNCQPPVSCKTCEEEIKKICTNTRALEAINKILEVV